MVGGNSTDIINNILCINHGIIKVTAFIESVQNLNVKNLI